MRGCRCIGTNQRGAATLEMMFAFPIIFLVLICGFMLGYYQFAKTALVWHVFKQTEDLAARTAVAGVVKSIADQVFKDPPAGLNGSTKSLAFAVPIPDHEFTFAVACHPTLLQIPRFDFGKAPPPASASPPARNAVEWLDRLARSVRAYANKAGGAVDQVEDVTDDVYLVNELIGQFGSKRPATRDQAVRLVASSALEAGMAYSCNQDGKQVIAVRAVAWSEKTKAYKKAGLKQINLPKLP
jgi:hypothetical protein